MNAQTIQYRYQKLCVPWCIIVFAWKSTSSDKV